MHAKLLMFYHSIVIWLLFVTFIVTMKNRHNYDGIKQHTVHICITHIASLPTTNMMVHLTSYIISVLALINPLLVHSNPLGYKLISVPNHLKCHTMLSISYTVHYLDVPFLNTFRSTTLRLTLSEICCTTYVISVVCTT